MTAAPAQVNDYLLDRHLFRQQGIVLPDGRTYGQAEEPWQREHIFAPLDAQDGHGGPLYRILYLDSPKAKRSLQSRP